MLSRRAYSSLELLLVALMYERFSCVLVIVAPHCYVIFDCLMSFTHLSLLHVRALCDLGWREWPQSGDSASAVVFLLLIFKFFLTFFAAAGQFCHTSEPGWRMVCNWK